MKSIHCMTGYSLVTDGIDSAVKQARAIAGDKDVIVMGGGSAASQCIKAGLIDEICIHLAPVLLGAGIRLFGDLGTEYVELESTGVIEGSGVTHLRFRVVK